MLDETFKALKEELFETFSSCDPTDTEGLKNLRLHLKALEQVQDKLTYAVNNGEYARKALTKTLAKTEETHAPRNPI